MEQGRDAHGRPVRGESGLRPGGRRPHVAAVAVLLGLSLLVYLPALTGGFVSDDSILLQHLQERKAAGGWGRLWREDLMAQETGVRTGFYRPLGVLSLAVDQRLYATNPVGYHVTNLVLNAATVCLVYAIALHVGLALVLACGAAALFATHPVHVEAVAWLSGRFDLLCGALYLLSMWLYMRAHGERRARWYLLALIAGAAALLSKEMALTLPAGIALVDALGLSRGRGLRRVVPQGLWREGWRGVILRVTPFALMIGIYLVLRGANHALGLNAVSGGAARLPRLEWLCTAGRAVLYYLGLLVAPVHLHAFPTVQPVLQLWSPWFLGGLAALVTLVVVAWHFRRTQPIASFGILFLLASLVPLSNALGIYALAKSRFPVAERYLYLPSFGFVIAVTSLGWALLQRRGARQQRAFVVACGLVVLAGAARSLARIPVWKSDDVLFAATVRESPESAWAHLMLGAVQRQKGSLNAARASIDTALRLDPKLYAAHLELGALELERRQYAASQHAFEAALALEPRGREARLGLASALRRAGKLPEAAQQFAVLGQLGANDSEFLVNRGELYLATGQLEAARRDFEAALVINPRRKEAVFNLGILALQQGRLEVAAEQAHRTLSLDPHYAEAHSLLGSVAVRRQDFDTATRQYGQAVALDSTQVQARVNLGVSYLNLGQYDRAIEVLQDAIRRQPSAQAFVNLAEAQSRGATLADAERSFRSALQLDADFAPARRGLGLLLARDPNRVQEARGYLAPIAAAHPEDAEVAKAWADFGRMSHHGVR